MYIWKYKKGPIKALGDYRRNYEAGLNIYFWKIADERLLIENCENVF